jgi:two-component system chemotaxis response regulator CheB
VPVAEIGELLNRLTALEVKEMAHSNSRNGNQREPERKKSSTALTCPDCQGTIWEVDENGEIRYECRVGHAYSPDGMAEAQDDNVERSLWMALRALEESATLEQRLAEFAGSRNRQSARKFYERKAHSRKQHAAVLREFLMGSRRRQSEAEGDLGQQEIERVS